MKNWTIVPKWLTSKSKKISKIYWNFGFWSWKHIQNVFSSDWQKILWYSVPGGCCMWSIFVCVKNTLHLKKYLASVPGGWKCWQEYSCSEYFGCSEEFVGKCTRWMSILARISMLRIFWQVYQVDERGSRPSMVPRVSDHTAWPGYNHHDDCDSFIIMVIIIMMMVDVDGNCDYKRWWWWRWWSNLILWHILFMSWPLQFFV